MCYKSKAKLWLKVLVALSYAMATAQHHTRPPLQAEGRFVLVFVLDTLAKDLFVVARSLYSRIGETSCTS